MPDPPDERDAPTVDERGPGPRAARASTPPREPAAADATRYRIGAEIARGGMGRVVEATDAVLGRVVAVKQALSLDADVLRRFARETRITARLEHPAIVPVHDAGVTADGTPYYVMRKVSGRPLSELVAAAEPIDARLALIPNVVAAAHAVAHAHQRGVVHRDLKPANILVGDNGETVVIDWGLAKVLDEPDDDDPHAGARADGAAIDAGGSLRTRIGTVFGTPGFMPPEQVRGESVDARGDVYALGATMYYVLSRRPPHVRDSADEMLVAAAAGPPTPIARYVAGLPPELSTIIDKALAFDGATRYPDASALADDLQRFLTGQLVASHRYSRRERIARFVRRNRAAFAAIAIATVAVTIVAVAAVVGIVGERDRADAAARTALDRAREADARADELLVERAIGLVGTNPTAAVALVKQLRSPPERWDRMWRRARAVAADAHVHGVAWSLPGPDVPVMLSMSASGNRVAAGDRLGELWVYDLERRRGRVIAKVKQRRKPEFADDTHLLAFRTDGATLIDLDTGAQRELAAIRDAKSVELTPTIAYWTDHAGDAWRTELASGATTLVAHGVQEIAVSPDRRWLAIADARGLALEDLRGAAPPRVVATGREIYQFAWSADSARLVVAALAEFGLFALTDSKIEWHRHERSMAFPYYAGPSLYLVGEDIARWNGQRVVGLKLEMPNLAFGAHVAHGDSLIVGKGNSVHVFGPERQLVLSPPMQSMSQLTSARASRFIVASVYGRIVVWDLSAIIPELPRTRGALGYGRVGDHDVITGVNPIEWNWIETDTGRVTKIRDLPAGVNVSDSRGELALAIDQTEERFAYIASKTAGEATAFADHVTMGDFVSDHEIVFATEAGTIEIYDTTSRRRSLAFQHTPAVSTFASRGPWVAAVYADGTILRRDRTTGTVTTLHATSVGGLALLDDGRACFARDRSLDCWLLDGRVVPTLALPQPGRVMLSSGSRVVVFTNEGAGYLADVATGRVIAIVGPGGGSYSFSFRADLAVFESGGGEVVDLVDGSRWPFIPPGNPTRNLLLSRDGTLVLGLVGTRLAAWRLDIPHDAAATAAWLDELTNATAERGPTSLSWR